MALAFIMQSLKYAPSFSLANNIATTSYKMVAGLFTTTFR